MGSFLEKPITEKKTEEGEGTLGGERMRYGVSAMQGWRTSMEDSHVHHLALGGKDLALFGVFDGHGGHTVSELIAKNLVEELVANDTFKGVDNCKGEAAAKSLGCALRETFLSLDGKLAEDGDEQSGSTAVCLMVTPTHHVVANCGDSRMIVVTSGAVRLETEDHKPTNVGETERIEKAGGTVSFKRVNGNLAVSRALGDFMYKGNTKLKDVEQQVSAEAELTVAERKPGDQFALLACDGIWDVMSNEQVAALVLGKMEAGYPLGLICETLLDLCLAKGSRDNMSVVIVPLQGAPAALGSLSPDEVRRRQSVVQLGDATDAAATTSS